jgi:hypothetical protein
MSIAMRSDNTEASRSRQRSRKNIRLRQQWLGASLTFDFQRILQQPEAPRGDGVRASIPLARRQFFEWSKE